MIAFDEKLAGVIRPSIGTFRKEPLVPRKEGTVRGDLMERRRTHLP
jgi:hypothetical protein